MSVVFDIAHSSVGCLRMGAKFWVQVQQTGDVGGIQSNRVAHGVSGSLEVP